MCKSIRIIMGTTMRIRAMMPIPAADATGSSELSRGR